MNHAEIIAWAHSKVKRFGAVPGVSQRSFTAEDEPKMKAALYVLLETEHKLVTALYAVQKLTEMLEAHEAQGADSMKLGKAKHG